MANTRVSDLPAGGPFANTDRLYAVETPGAGGVQKTLTQLAEWSRDEIAAFIVGGSNISVVHNDAADTLTVSDIGAPLTSTDDLPEGVTNLYFTNERAQDAVGAMVDSTLVYVDGTPLLTRAALTGDVTAPQASNVTEIAAGAVTFAKIAAGTVREVLTAARTYYVRTDGNDGNTGLVDSAGGAFLTVQRAIDVVAALDASIYDVTIQVRDGTYNMPRIILRRPVGSGTMRLTGNTAAPANCVLNNTSNGTAGSSGFISATSSGGPGWIVDGFTFQKNAGGGTATTANAIYVNGTSLVTSRNVFDSATGAAWTIGCLVESLGALTQDRDFTISGNYSTFWQAQSQGQITFNGAPSPVATLTGTPAISASFCRASLGGVFVGRGTFSGAATGVRHSFVSGGTFSVTGGSTSYFPGSLAGTGVNGVDGFFGA